MCFMNSVVYPYSLYIILLGRLNFCLSCNTILTFSGISTLLKFISQLSLMFNLNLSSNLIISILVWKAISKFFVVNS